MANHGYLPARKSSWSAGAKEKRPQMRAFFQASADRRSAWWPGYFVPQGLIAALSWL
jgi:hypothetical protein